MRAVMSSKKALLFRGGHEGFGPPPPAVREIVFASDLSPASDRTFDHARLLAEGFGAHLVLYHVLEAKEDASEPRDVEMRHRLERAAREHLERRAQGLPIPTDVHVERAASAWPSLAAFVRTAKPDIIVMGTHGRKGVAHFVLGSVTERVLQHTRLPTLCVREPDHGVALPYRRILVPTDLSLESRRAFPLAAALARVFGAEILAVHVADIHVRGATWGVTTAIEDHMPSELRVEELLRPDMADVRIRARVELGTPCDAIASIASDEHADVIVLSTHGEDSLGDRLRGTHAERIIRQAPCPVLVV